MFQPMSSALFNTNTVLIECFNDRCFLMFPIICSLAALMFLGQTVVQSTSVNSNTQVTKKFVRIIGSSVLRMLTVFEYAIRLPGDSDQKPTHSICLKFAIPTYDSNYASSPDVVS